MSTAMEVKTIPEMDREELLAERVRMLDSISTFEKPHWSEKLRISANRLAKERIRQIDARLNELEACHNVHATQPV
jgi:CRISPR/Cas system CSM-associated protein Csm5 (group 7 of RAMP superfamily)